MQKMLRSLSEKLRPKFPATKCGYSMAKIARQDDAYLEANLAHIPPANLHNVHICVFG